MNERLRSSSPLASQQKPAWGKVNSGGKGVVEVQNEFPTVAEVAYGQSWQFRLSATSSNIPLGHKVQILQDQLENQMAAEAVAAQRQAMMQTADSFRGVHLDPNAHHWDEVR